MIFILPMAFQTCGKTKKIFLSLIQKMMRCIVHSMTLQTAIFPQIETLIAILLTHVVQMFLFFNSFKKI